MNLTSLSEVRSLLTDIGVRPNSKLGQNFLIDRNILDIIIKMADVGHSDRILEVGPGLGTLTEGLLEKASFVTAIEKDHRLYKHLEASIGSSGNLSLVHSDALDVDFSRIVFNRFVANLPYCVGSRILVDLFMMQDPPESITVTLQLEVADRLAAKPDTSDYGLLSVLCQLVYDVVESRKISPGCFWPPPDIHSAVIHMVKRKEGCLSQQKKVKVRALVKNAFSQRRKKLSTIFKSLNIPASAFERAGVSPDSRPEDISPDKWLSLSNVSSASEGEADNSGNTLI